MATMIAMVPMASAIDASSCATQQDPRAITVGDQYYVKEYHPSGAVYVYLYQETNGAAGLQTSYSSCGWGKPMLEPDRLVGSFNTYSGF